MSVARRGQKRRGIQTRYVLARDGCTDRSTPSIAPFAEKLRDNFDGGSWHGFALNAVWRCATRCTTEPGAGMKMRKLFIVAKHTIRHGEAAGSSTR